MIFIWVEPIIWNSRHQSTVESSAFGSEFLVLKYGKESNRENHYKLRMLGVEIDRPKDILSDHMSVVLNASLAILTLRKRQNPIIYHAVRWYMASKDLEVWFMAGKDNLVDPLMNIFERSKHALIRSWSIWWKLLDRDRNIGKPQWESLTYRAVGWI